MRTFFRFWTKMVLNGIIPHFESFRGNSIYTLKIKELKILNRLVSFSVHILQLNGLKPEETEGIGGNPMSLMDKDVVLTTNEAIKYLKISKPTFLKYIRLGRIKATKAGNGWRVHQSELYRFLKVGEK